MSKKIDRTSNVYGKLTVLIESLNRVVEYKRKVLRVNAWAEKLNINTQTLISRLNCG